MKRIYIVRHAKSSWADLSMRDFERPLNNRGKRDAPRIAEWCKEKGYIPEQLISSDAERAKTTAKIFVEAFFGSEDSLTLEHSLYHAPEDKYFDVCHRLEASVESVMLFGHNPGITYLVNLVSKKFIDNVPTCGVLVIDSNAKEWQDVDENNCTLVDFLYPKLNKE